MDDKDITAEAEDRSTGTLAGPVQAGPPRIASRRAWLGEIASWDPVLAWTLLQTGRCTGGYADTGGWEILNLIGRFESGAANETVEGNFDGLVEADLWVRKVTYTVRRPLAFADNILKSQSDYYNALNPNIDFTLTIDSYCQYLISPQPTPLENIGIAFECVCPAGLVLRCSSRIQAQYTSLRALSSDVGEIPTEAIITLHTTRLPRDLYGQCGREQAIAVLRELRLMDE